MKHKSWLILTASLVLASLLGSGGGTWAYYNDTEISTCNNFIAWVSNMWNQTNQDDFDAGVLINTDTSTSLGNVQLNTGYSSGSLASQVLDTGINGASWDALCWDKTLPSGTVITFKVRASDTIFTKDAITPAWVPVGDNSPVIPGLSSGRYKQWQAILTTTDISKTPTLQAVRVYYR